MEQIQYLEITSSRRNRNQDRLSSSFEIPLSQSGQKQALDALDPVCLSAAKNRWTGNSFNALQSATDPSELIVMIDDVTISGSGTKSIGNASSTTTLMVNTTGVGTSGRGSLQLDTDYYLGAVAGVGDGSTVTLDRRRIIQYTYLGDDRAQFVFEGMFSTALTAGTTLLYIVDPTDVDNPNYTFPYFFVPVSASIPNSFVNFVLFNQTRCQSRRVKDFDRTTHLLGIYTSGSVTSTTTEGPVSTWMETDLYSIRKENPISCITALAGDTANNVTTFRSFNLSIADADTITNPTGVAGSFLEIQMDRDVGTLQFQGGGTGTTTIQLTALSNIDDGYYNGSTLRVLSGAAAGQQSRILSYDGVTKIATLDKGFSNAAGVGDNYDLVMLQEEKRIIKYVDYRANAVGGSTTTVNFPILSNNVGQPLYINNYYDNLFINVPTRGGTRKITNYTVTLNPLTQAVQSAIATIDPLGSPFTGAVVAGDAFTITSGLIEGGAGQFTYSISTQPAYILQFSYDNLFPFINAQSQIGSNQNWYDLELLNLILPNQILNSGGGGLISFYQYVYVEIENTNGAGTSGSNNIISNNPNAVGMTFRATIDDVPNPVNSTFIKIDGDGMTQIVRFDPQDNLKFSVYLSTGSNPDKKELIKFLIDDSYSPDPPNNLIQISAMFSMKKVIMKQDIVARNI
jgi:hypothetical protein